MLCFTYEMEFALFDTLHLETVCPHGDEFIFSFKEFHCLKNLSLGGLYGWFYLMDPEFVRIDPPNLEMLTIYQGNAVTPFCKFVVSTPKLKCFRFSGRYVPVVSAEGGFPCLEHVEFDINVGNGERMNVDADTGIYTLEDYRLELDDNQLNEIMLKISSLFREFSETKVLLLSPETFEVMYIDRA